jgi:3-oxocholest-4-en-26-oate---CoA ligase
VVDRQVKGICIVGDPFAKPIITELTAHPGRWDLEHVRLIVSSGAALSRQSKERLLEFAPRARIADGLASSESGSLGTAVTTTPNDAVTGRFRLGENVRVLDEDGRDVVAGSGQPGRLAVGGHLPLGYYGDAAKTASTFVVLDGHRYVIAGDWVTLDEQGVITLLGRGSGCINTAGEKVYPEEVESVLKWADGVRDASVVGVEDDRLGEAVVALVELEPGAELDEASLIRHVKEHLAGFKAPKAVVRVDAVVRHANGKMDHAAMQQIARSAVHQSH